MAEEYLLIDKREKFLSQSINKSVFIRILILLLIWFYCINKMVMGEFLK